MPTDEARSEAPDPLDPTPGSSEPRFDVPRAPAIKTAKLRAKQKATLHGEVRKSDKPILIVGATGSFGGAIAQELIERGERARLFVRDQKKAVRMFGSFTPAEIVHGDAQDSRAVSRAAEGCRAIVHAVMYPPHLWDPNMIGVTANIVAAASETKAPVLFPANNWVYGEKIEQKPLAESTPFLPSSRVGRLEVEIENSLQKSAEEKRIKVIVLRAGHYFGPTVRNSFVDGIFGRAASGRPMQLLGRPDIPHQWAYAPDVARAAIYLLDRAEGLPSFLTIHFKGHVAIPQSTFLKRIAEISEHPNLKIKRVPWFPLKLLGVVHKDVKAVLDLQYLFDGAIILDDRLFRRAWPDFTPTDLDDAIARTIVSYRSTNQ